MLLRFIVWKMTYDINIKDLTAVHIPRGQSLSFSV